MRDPREITVAGDARSTRPAAQGRRASVRPVAGPSEWRAILVAVVGGLARTCRSNPGGVLGSGVALAAVVVVSMNALGFQAGRHPAPILPKVAIRQDAVAARAVPETMPETAKAAESARPPAAKVVEAPKAPARDAIADLIRSEDTTASVTPKPQGAVMQAQRALSKLGYGPLKADGLMGASTRAAIEKFERDRKLPVKGEAAGRTLRELAARAGLPPA